jgi:uncharacterized protein (TIGR02145 family)
MKIAFKNSKILMINGRTLTPVPGIGPEPGLHYVYTSSEGNGFISASPMSGKKNTLITLSNTPDRNYIFSKYTLNNVDLAGSSFLMPDEDAYVRGYFQPDVRTITVTQPSHGTITAPASAQIGSTVTLSCTPDSGYTLQYFTVNGSQIQGNSFVMPASNVTVSASLAEDPLATVTIGSQKWTKKNLAVNDGQGGIYTRSVNYGKGDVTEYYYTWDAAMRVVNSIAGFHLPSVDEYSTLISTVGGGPHPLLTNYGWQYGGGSNAYGFSALPSGGTGVPPSSDSYFQIGAYFYVWTSTEVPSTFVKRYAYVYYLCDGSTGIASYTSYKKTDSAFPIRLIKDS